MSEGENDERFADVWGISSGQNTPILIFDARGIATSKENLDTYKAAIESAIENTFSIEISEVTVSINRYQIGEPIEDWDTYEQVN